MLIKKSLCCFNRPSQSLTQLFIRQSQIEDEKQQRKQRKTKHEQKKLPIVALLPWKQKNLLIFRLPKQSFDNQIKKNNQEF